MSITLTYTFATAEELAAHLNGTGRNTQPTPAVKTEAAPAKKPDAPAASSPSGAKPQTTAQPAAAQDTDTAPAREDAAETWAEYEARVCAQFGITLKENQTLAQALTMRLVTDKGRDTAAALLNSHGVPVAAKLPADKIEAFCREAEEMLK